MSKADYQAPHPVVELLLERKRQGSQRGKRTDGRVLALAVEGGGLRGTVSAGMCIALEAAGLLDAVDVIYGTSSGALNGSFTTSGQAMLGATNYEDSASRQLFNPLRLLVGRAPVNFDFLFDEVIRNRRPYDERAFWQGPKFTAVAVDPFKRAVRTLADYKTMDELMRAVRVSCSMPLLTGRPLQYKGHILIDGGMLEPMPYESALREGATDVLVLRSRPARDRKLSSTPKPIRKLLRRIPGINAVSLLSDSSTVYNRQAADLQKLSAQADSHVYQIAPSQGNKKVRMVGYSVKAVRQGLLAGAQVAARALNLPDPKLHW